MSIQTFNLVKERLLLVNLNLRTEMHGDQRESAVDIAFEFDSANNILAKLHKDLRTTFYRGDDTADMLNPEHMPHLRLPLLGPISWDVEIPRTRLVVHDVDDASHDVVLGGGRTNKFRLTMKEGGTVNWKFRVQFSKPDEDMVARLMRVLNQKVPVSLECVDEEEKPDNFEQVEQLSSTGQAASAARQQLESLFDKPPTDMTIANGTDTVSVESVHDGSAGQDDDVVDAEFIADPEQVETEPVTIDTPAPKAKRGAKKKESAAIE